MKSRKRRIYYHTKKKCDWYVWDGDFMYKVARTWVRGKVYGVARMGFIYTNINRGIKTQLGWDR